EVVEEVPDRVLGGEVRGKTAQRVERVHQVFGVAAVAVYVVGVRRVQVQAEVVGDARVLRRRRQGAQQHLQRLRAGDRQVIVQALRGAGDPRLQLQPRQVGHHIGGEGVRVEDGQDRLHLPADAID